MWVLLFVGFGLPSAAVAARWWAQRAQQAQQQAATPAAGQPAQAGHAAPPPGPDSAGSSPTEPTSPWGGSKSSGSVHAGSNSTPSGAGSRVGGATSSSDASDESSAGRPPLLARLHGPLAQAVWWLALAPAAGAALWSALEAFAAP